MMLWCRFREHPGYVISIDTILAGVDEMIMLWIASPLYDGPPRRDGRGRLMHPTKPIIRVGAKSAEGLAGLLAAVEGDLP